MYIRVCIGRVINMGIIRIRMILNRMFIIVVMCINVGIISRVRSTRIMRVVSSRRNIRIRTIGSIRIRTRNGSIRRCRTRRIAIRINRCSRTRSRIR